VVGWTISPPGGARRWPLLSMFRAATAAPATDVELVNQKERERGKVKE
jgi:hypothetical protein